MAATGVLPEERGGTKVRRGQQQDGKHRPDVCEHRCAAV